MSIQEKNRVVMLWAGYGAGEIDVQFRKKAEECTRRGEPFGVYWHSYAWHTGYGKEGSAVLRRDN